MHLSREPAQLAVALDPGPGADEDELERLVLGLRTELLELDVEDVEPLTDGAAPDGARGLEAIAVGALIVRVIRSPEALRALTGTIRRWLGPRPERSVRIELDGDVLQLSGATGAETEKLVDAWIARHAVA